jgi:hypothetical protein
MRENGLCAIICLLQEHLSTFRYPLLFASCSCVERDNVGVISVRVTFLPNYPIVTATLLEACLYCSVLFLGKIACQTRTSRDGAIMNRIAGRDRQLPYC